MSQYVMPAVAALSRLHVDLASLDLARCTVQYRYPPSITSLYMRPRFLLYLHSIQFLPSLNIIIVLRLCVLVVSSLLLLTALFYKIWSALRPDPQSPSFFRSLHPAVPSHGRQPAPKRRHSIPLHRYQLYC